MTVHGLVLVVHSYLRWVVVTLLLATLVRSLWRWRREAAWERADERLHAASVGGVDLQFTLGLLLYAVLSPLPRAFFADVAAGMKAAPLRFFGMEHALGMLVATAVIHIGRRRSQRTQDPRLRHKTVGLFSSLGLVLICASVPWPGCSSGRPLLRPLSSGSEPVPSSRASSEAECPPLYTARCAACHGPSGRGDGPSALSLNPPPRDLTSPSFQRYVSDEALRKVIAGGGNAVGLGPMMPAHPDLSPTQIDALVRCVRSFGRAQND